MQTKISFVLHFLYENYVVRRLLIKRRQLVCNIHVLFERLYKNKYMVIQIKNILQYNTGNVAILPSLLVVIHWEFNL